MVPGYICVIEEGQTVPADGRVRAVVHVVGRSLTRRCRLSQATTTGTVQRPSKSYNSGSKSTSRRGKSQRRMQAPTKGTDAKAPPRLSTAPEFETKGAVGNGDGPQEAGDEKGADNDGERDEANKEQEKQSAQKGPSVFSVDQSAVTGVSLAVDKCASQLRSPLTAPFLSCAAEADTTRRHRRRGVLHEREAW